MSSAANVTDSIAKSTRILPHDVPASSWLSRLATPGGMLVAHSSTASVAVDTREKFRGQNLTDDLLREFFQTGVDHVKFIFETIRSRLDPHFAPRSALDFGCGVGRLLIPLARQCNCVVGVDVSETMLREARDNCEHQGISNIRLIKADSSDCATLGPVDLVHSFIVFQHISPRWGEAIFRRLIPKDADCSLNHPGFQTDEPRQHGFASRISVDDTRWVEGLATRVCPPAGPVAPLCTADSPRGSRTIHVKFQMGASMP